MSSPEPSPRSDHRQVVQRFRGDQRAALPLHPLEKALVITAGAQLVFMPWALGTMHVWSQLTALGLATLSFILALIPRHYTADYAREGEFRLSMWPKLLRFPIFWLGLLLLGYITIQALNPSYAYAERLTGGYMILPIPHVEWLPTSVEAPFAKMNAWRVLIITGTAWLLACALWVGLTRRRAVNAVLNTIVINGAVLGILGVVQKVTGAHKIFWSIESANESFFASFIYRNHGGAYLNLALGATVALAWFHHQRAARRLAKSSPAAIYIFGASIFVIAGLLTVSRGAILSLAGFLAMAVLGFALGVIRTPAGHRNFPILISMLLLFAGFSWVGLRSIDTSESVGRFQQMLEGGDANVEARKIATLAATDMRDAQWVTGWGAGSFRWMFPAFQQNYPSIYRTGGITGAMFLWEHAHNDWAELPAELGLIGTATLGAMVLSLLALALLAGGGRFPSSLVLLAACLMAVLHSRGEFLFSNPAILVLGSALLTLSARWPAMATRN